MLELNKLKQLLGIPLDDISKGVMLEFVLDDVFQVIKDYCHIKEVPEELNNTVLRMAMQAYRAQNLGSEENSLGSVSSVTDGDTSVSYRGINSELKDSLIMDYKTQLNRYRRLVW